MMPYLLTHGVIKTLEEASHVVTFEAFEKGCGYDL
jgi:hypothetical protein